MGVGTGVFCEEDTAVPDKPVCLGGPISPVYTCPNSPGNLPARDRDLRARRHVLEQCGENVDARWTADGVQIIEHQHLVRRMPVPDHIYEYATKLVRKTRPRSAASPAWLKPLVAWGAGPRAVQNLILGAKARAALYGSYMVRLEDVHEVAVPVLTHRVITTFAAQAEGLDAQQIVRRLIAETIEE